MRCIPGCLLAVVLVLAVGCSRGGNAPAPPGHAAAPGQEPSSGGLAPLPVPDAVPADASIVVLVRSPQDAFDALLGMSLDAPGIAAVKHDVAAFLRARIGIDYSGASCAVVAITTLDPLQWVVITPGAQGTPLGPSAGAESGVPLVTIDPPSGVVAAVVRGTLLSGTLAAARAAVAAAAGGNGLCATDPGFCRMVEDAARTGVLVAAADARRLPDSVARSAAAQGVRQAVLSIGPARTRLLVAGDNELLAVASRTISDALDAFVVTVQSAKATAIAGGGTVTGGVLSIVEADVLARMRAGLHIDVAGGRLTAELPLHLADSGSVVVLLGMASAIAVPAFMRYVEAAKAHAARDAAAMPPSPGPADE